MNRIKAIYSYIDINDKVVDVGCDSAKLGIMLAFRNQYSIASDISEKVISSARSNIEKLGLSKYIELRVSDGLKSINEEEVDTLVLSGMGTHNILNIIKQSNNVYNKIITISNNNHDILRKNMNKINYYIESEQIIEERGKFYNLILFKPGLKKYSEIDFMLGVNHTDKKMYIKYLKHLLDKFTNIKQKSKDSNSNIDKMILYINKKLEK